MLNESTPVVVDIPLETCSVARIDGFVLIFASNIIVTRAAYLGQREVAKVGAVTDRVSIYYFARGGES